MAPRTRNALFYVIMLVSVWVLLEAISFVASRAINHAWFSFSEARRQLDAIAPASSSESGVIGLADLKWNEFAEVLHPYAGFVADPEQNKPMWKVSDFGFVLNDAPNPILKRTAGKTIVAVFGGSFANSAYLSLKNLLAKEAPGQGREFLVLNFSMAGDKQPQQLMVLNYLLALGAEFDVVINLDGFNEVALPVAENIPAGVNPFYPRGWDRRTANAINSVTIRLIGLVEVTKTQRQNWAQTFQRLGLYHSPLLFLVWQMRDRGLARTIYKTNEKVRASGNAKPYVMRGPHYSGEGEEKTYRDLVEVWKRCSVEMKYLCDANGAKYFHFLQPNQYVEGSKPMGAAEQHQALNAKNPYKPAVVRGYPMLAEAGRELQHSGVNFTDLTMIYSTHDGLLYTDDCCHTNTEGSDIAARRIYDAMQGKP
jgi:hypothetical protein